MDIEIAKIVAGYGIGGVFMAFMYLQLKREQDINAASQKRERERDEALLTLARESVAAISEFNLLRKTRGEP